MSTGNPTFPTPGQKRPEDKEQECSPSLRQLKDFLVAMGEMRYIPGGEREEAKKVMEDINDMFKNLIH